MRSGASLPSAVSGMSIGRELAVRAQLRVLRLERVSDRGQDLERRDVRVEGVGLALAVGDRLGRQRLADDRALVGAADVEQEVLAGLLPSSSTSRPGCPWPSASASGLASASLSIAVLMMASVPSRMADSIAFWTFSGEPSVATTSTSHPRVAAPSLTSLPWNTQTSMPQLIQVTFLPVGIGLSIGFVWVICVGRLYALSTSCCASSSLADDDATARAAPPPSSPPHPAAQQHGGQGRHEGDSEAPPCRLPCGGVEHGRLLLVRCSAGGPVQGSRVVRPKLTSVW